MHRITPFVKRMRTNGGTIYTFSSSVEDIGLNINERNNVVKISHFALLDIPQINEPQNIEENRFNINAIPGAFEYNQGSQNIKDGRVLIAESFQNYALNVEANLLNREDYEPTLVRTVTERVFWKWLKESGAIRWSPDISTNGTQYWSEPVDADGSLGYNSVVKYVGLVSAGNARTDTFGTYNETYVMVPTSHGQTDAYFKITEDENYYHGMTISEDGGKNILGRTGYTLPHPDGLDYRSYYDMMDSSTQVNANGDTWNTFYDASTGSWTPGWWYSAEGRDPGYAGSVDNVYLTDTSSYLADGIYHTDLRYQDGALNTIDFRRSKVDCLSLVLDLDQLKNIYSDTALTYDKLAIENSINDNFNFNTILLYYTVYNSTMDQVLGVNLLGVLFIDAPNGNSSNIGFDGITIPSIEKIQTGPGGFGTSYSFRLNIKTDTMVDDTQLPVVDKSTSDQVYAEDWAASFANLDKAVQILQRNNGTISYISAQYVDVRSTQTQILNDLQSLQHQVNDIGRDIQGETNSLAMFAEGDDPLVDSSVYMRFGNVGIKNKDPKYPLHISGTTKADEVIIEKSIKDISGNILLGYGSPIQIGASTNYRRIDSYTGDSVFATSLDASSFTINRDVSLNGNFLFDGDGEISGTLNVNQIQSPNFDFNTSYIRDTSNGSTITWINGYLEASISSTATAAGPSGSLQYKNNAGLLDGMQQLDWSSSEYVLRVTGTIDSLSEEHSKRAANFNMDANQVTSNTTNYDIVNYVGQRNNFSIGSGITDSGYRIALDIHGYSSDSQLAGILNEQYGIRLQYGHYYGSGSGTISNAYGLKLNYLNSGASNVGSSYSLHSSGGAPMYHDGTIITGVGSGTDILRQSYGNKTIMKRTTSQGGLAIGVDDSLILGSGEARATLESQVSLTSEEIYLGADNGVSFYSNLQNGWASRHEARLDTAGNFRVESLISTGSISGPNVTSGADPGHTHSLSSSSLSGTLPVSKGGTGATSLTSNRILTGNGTGAIQAESNLSFSGTDLTNSAGAFICDTYFRSSDNAAVLGTGSNGTVYIRPDSYNSSTDQTTFTTSVATIGTNLTVNGNETITGAFYLNSSNIPTGTPSGSEYLFIDTSDSNRVKRAGITAVQWSGSTANGIGTYNGSSSIQSEPNLTFDGTWLDITGNIELKNGDERTIRVESNSSTSNHGDNLRIYAGTGGSNSGAGLEGGSALLYGGFGGNATISGSNGGDGGYGLVRGGDGGDINGGVAVGGQGGPGILRGGDGGDGYIAGNGGHVYIYGGDSGSGASGYYGNVYLGFTGPATGDRGYVYARLASSSQDYKVVYNTLSHRLTYEYEGSDERIKRNFVPLSGAEILDKIDNIQGYNFQYNSLAKELGFEDVSTLRVGLIAQEVEKVFPEVVKESTYPDPSVMETVKKIEYDKMVPYLVESIKELKKIIQSQQEEIEKLKNQ
jgi:hypothetical protein